MNILFIILTIFFIFFIGFMIIQFFNLLPNSLFLEKIAYSWGLGVGIIGLQLFLYSVFGIDWDRVSILSPWILFGIYFLIKNYKNPKIKIKKLKLTKIETFFVLLIFLLVFFTGFESILRPIQAWDGWDNWVFRPKVFFIHNNLSFDYVRYTNDEYPLIIPLMGTFSYIMMGHVDDRLVLLLFFMFYVMLGGLFFINCKKYFSTRYSILFTFLLLSLQNLIRHGGRFEVGQADLALSYYIFAGTILLVNFIKIKNYKILLLLSIFLGITAQIKNDGVAFFYIINFILIFYIIRWRKYKYILFLLPSFILLYSWQLYKIVNHYPPNMLMASGINIQLERIGIVIVSMSKEFFNLQNWNLLWIVFFASIINLWKKLGQVKIFMVVLLLQWLSYSTAFLLTPREPAGHIANVIDKLYIHLAPIAVLVVGILLYNQILSKSKYKW